jgi:hypothetical protein
MSVVSSSQIGLGDLPPQPSPSPLLAPESSPNLKTPSPEILISEAMADWNICKPCAEWIRKHITEFDNLDSLIDGINFHGETITFYQWSRSDERCFVCFRLSAIANATDVLTQAFYAGTNVLDVNSISFRIDDFSYHGKYRLQRTRGVFNKSKGMIKYLMV